MYVRKHNWIAGPVSTKPTHCGKTALIPVPASRVSFSTLQHAVRKSRGMGQTTYANVDVDGYVAGGPIPPIGSPCYDPTAWFPHLLGIAADDENACLAAQPANVTLTQQLSTVLAPGLPVGYNPATGTVTSSNTTGTTVASTQAELQAALQSAVGCPAGTVTNPNTGQCGAAPTTNDWCSQNLGVGCVTVAVIAGVVVLLAAFVGGRR